jgi:coproporphyrinogen III oxidase-like Fe-S oxidoreductase
MTTSVHPQARPEPGVATTKPLLIYVNVPFCNSKCHFCDWVAQVPVRDLRLTDVSPGRVRYLAALTRQIAAQAPALRDGGYRPEVMYWGGGTASILTVAEIEPIRAALTEHFDLSGVAEATIEGSPESLDPEKLRALRTRLGFNRISIGVQSFDDARLRMIGRSHSADQAVAAVRAAREAGFDNINIDLIVGFPEQSMAEVEATARRAVQLPVNHFSVYPYRSSPGTVLRKQVNRGLGRVDLDLQMRAYGRTADILQEAGHEEYAMSYFGSPRCQSDEAYYQLKMDWIGFGSGANSLVNQRFLTNKRGELHQYNAHPTTFDMDVPAKSPALTLHFLSQALTTAEGLDPALFAQRTGMSLREACKHPDVLSYLRRMRRHGDVLIDREGIRLRREDISKTYIALNWIQGPDA